MCDSGTSERGRPRGAALIISMLVMAVLLLAGTTFMTISSTEGQIALNETALTRAFHEAEGLMDWTIARLSANAGYAGATGTISGGGSFTVQVTAAASQICPTADGKQIAVRASVGVRGGQAVVDLSAAADRIIYPFRFAAYSVVPNTIVTDGRVEQELLFDAYTWTDSFDSTLGAYNASFPLNYTTRINRDFSGSAGANGDSYFVNPTWVLGDLLSGDAINNPGNVTITGVQYTGFAPNASSIGERFLPVASPVTPVDSLSVAAGVTVTLGGTDEAPVYNYYYTSMAFGSGSTLTVSRPVTIYVTGSVSVGDSVTWGNSTNPTWLKVVLQSTGAYTSAMTLSTGTSFNLHGGLYGRNANIDFNNGSGIYGAVIGRIVRLRYGTAIHYNQALALVPICHTGDYQVRKGTWREVLPSW